MCKKKKKWSVRLEHTEESVKCEVNEIGPQHVALVSQSQAYGYIIHLSLPFSLPSHCII